jgi:type VI secretion system protein ImpG
MNRTLLDYYETELDRFRKDGDVLAGSHASQRAGALRNLFASPDPFVNQLVQAFAYTQARLELKLDAERDRLPATLLQMLYPGVARPVPARSIVRFKWDDGEIPKAGRRIDAGTVLRPRGGQGGSPLQFRTVGPCILPPVELKGVQLTEADSGRLRLRLRLESPRPESLKLSALTLALPELADGPPLPANDPRRFGLRLFTGGAESVASFAVFHALTLNAIDGELVLNDGRRLPLPNCVRLAGYDSNESLLPIDHRILEPLRLLTEYATFREKFLFLDLVGLHPSLFAGAEGGASVDLLIDDSRAAEILDKFRQQVTLRLGCVPVVNLKEEDLRTVALLRRTTEYAVRVDAAEGPPDREIFSIDKVRATRLGRTKLQYTEMFRPLPPRLEADHQPGGYWHARRVHRASAEAAPVSLDDRLDTDPTTTPVPEVLLSLVEFDPQQTLESGLSLQVRATCFDRDVGSLANLPVPIRLAADNGATCELATELYPPFQVPNLDGDIALRLIEHLSCGVGLLQNWGDPRAAVGRLLSLVWTLFPVVSGNKHLLSDAFVTALAVLPTATPHAGGIARGVKLKMTVNTGTGAGASHEAYLLLRVLDVTLSGFCSSGGFSQLNVDYNEGRDSREIKCPPRIGKIPLL